MAKSKYDSEYLLRRAFAAHFRSGEADTPNRATSAVEEHAGKTYVVLRNVHGVLAVYRLRGTGLLRKLIRWPNSIED